jgi:hypothetical protein
MNLALGRQADQKQAAKTVDGAAVLPYAAMVLSLRLGGGYVATAVKRANVVPPA